MRRAIQLQTDGGRAAPERTSSTLPRRQCWGWSVYLVLLPVIIWPRTDALAEDWIKLDPLEAEAILRFDGHWRRTSGAPGSRDFKYEERVRIKQSGYSLDPRIVSFSLEAEPTFTQGGFKSASASDSRKGKFFNYNGTLNVLQGAPGPFSLGVNASRSTGVTDGILGNRTEFDTVRRSATINWRNPYLPLTLSISEDKLDDLQIIGASSTQVQRKEKRRSAVLSGRNSKMNYRLERQWMDDQSIDLDRNFTLTRAKAAHTFRWGKGSTARTDADFFDRKGFNPYKRTTVREAVNIKHLPSLTSSTGYGFTILDRGQKTSGHQGAFSLTHNLYKNLRSTLSLRGDIQRSDLSDENEYEGSARTTYSKKLFGADVIAGFGGAYRLSDRKSEEGFISIVDEAHSIPLSGTVILERRFINPASIIVTASVDDFVLIEDTDYEIIDIGDDLTEIRIIQGGRVDIGALIVVSYDYQILPTMKFSTSFFDYQISIDLGWMKLSHSDSRANETLKSPLGEGFLNDRMRQATRVDFEWDARSLRATVGAERTKTRNGELRSRNYTFRQSVYYDPSRKISMSLSASQSFIKSNDRRSGLYTLEYSARWRPFRSLTLRPRVNGWMRTDTGGFLDAAGSRKTRILNAGLDLQWALRKIRLDIRYTHSIRKRDATTAGEDRVFLTLRRKY